MMNTWAILLERYSWTILEVDHRRTLTNEQETKKTDNYA